MLNLWKKYTSTEQLKMLMFLLVNQLHLHYIMVV